MLEALVSGDILEGLEALEAALEPTLGTDPAAVFCSFVDTAHRIIYDAVAEDRLGAAAKMASRLSDDVAEYFRAMLEHTSRPVMRQRLLQILYASDGGEGGGAAESAYGPLLDVTPTPAHPKLWAAFIGASQQQSRAVRCARWPSAWSSTLPTCRWARWWRACGWCLRWTSCTRWSRGRLSSIAGPRTR